MRFAREPVSRADLTLEYEVGKRMKTIFLCACSLSLPLLAAEPMTEAALIQVLTGESSYHQKSDACIELGLVGSQASVVPLTALLADEELSHMARYALETIPHPRSTRRCAPRLTAAGRLLTGVIQSVACGATRGRCRRWPNISVQQTSRLRRLRRTR